MGRRKSDHPEVGKRMIRGAWSVHWWWDGKMFSVAVGVSGEEMKDTAEAVRRAISSAIAAGTSFPPPYDVSRAAIRYREMRYGGTAGEAGGSNPGEWMADYSREILAECATRWAEWSIKAIERLEKEAGNLSAVTPGQASSHLAAIADAHSVATRNRAFAACSRFYKWAIRTDRTRINPFSEIKTLREERGSEIIHCTPAEREEILVMAIQSGWPDWMAIPVAFYSGMRREEVSRLAWEDIRFGEGLIVVQKSKTGKSRVVPLASALEAILMEIPALQRHGPVVVTPPDIDRLLRLDNLVRHIRRMKRDQFLSAHSLEKPPPSRSKEYRDSLAKWKAAMKGRTRDLDAALERIGWNPFRHTFGSLLAQAGVSVDKISAWMGNTPEVCRRHYAQFIPRDRRDSEIDKL